MRAADPAVDLTTQLTDVGLCSFCAVLPKKEVCDEHGSMYDNICFAVVSLRACVRGTSMGTVRGGGPLCPGQHAANCRSRKLPEGRMHLVHLARSWQGANLRYLTAHP